MTRYATVLYGSLWTAAIVCTFGSPAAAQTLPSPWIARDVGAPALSGSATYNAGVFTIQGAGTDIAGLSDQFQFVYQQVTGDVDVIALVQSVTSTTAMSKAGVMIRASLAADSPHAYTFVSAGKGAYFRRRRNAGAKSPTVQASTDRAPLWVRTVRRGSEVSGYISRDGATWTLVATDTIKLGSSAYVGIAVTSRQETARTTAKASNVTVNVVGLPAGQQDTDIGSPAIAGKAEYAGGAYTIKAAGTDIWGSADQFHFVYQPITNDAEIVARVASIQKINGWTRAGVMIRESLTASSAHAMVALSAAKGYAFDRRGTTGATTDRTVGSVVPTPGWVRLVRTGDVFDAYSSPDGSTWTKIGSDAIPMSATVYAGIAVTSRDATIATTAVLDSLAVKTTTTGDLPPAISITAPAGGAQYTAPATVTLAATATDPEGRMASVDFYVDTTLVGRDTSSPYSVSWSASTPGTYSVTGTAHDAAGSSTTSSAVTVSILASGSGWQLTFTASTDHSTNVDSYVLDVFAAGVDTTTAAPLVSSNLGKPAPDSTGTITVDATTLLSALAAGNYQLTITAKNAFGTARSAAVLFTK